MGDTHLDDLNKKGTTSFIFGIVTLVMFIWIMIVGGLKVRNIKIEGRDVIGTKDDIFNWANLKTNLKTFYGFYIALMVLCFIGFCVFAGLAGFDRVNFKNTTEPVQNIQRVNYRSLEESEPEYTCPPWIFYKTPGTRTCYQCTSNFTRNFL